MTVVRSRAESLLERLIPRRLGRGFRVLLAATASSNLADGIALAAGPLLIASQTSSPTLVALATVLQRVPWFFFGLGAGIVADRVNRGALIVLGNVLRVVVLAVLVATIVGDAVNIALVLATMFLLGSAETFTDIGSEALVPAIVPPEHLGPANARFVFAFKALNQLAGPPLGAFLFALGLFVPFATQGALLALAAILVARLSVPSPEADDEATVLADLRAGARWLWHHAPVRTLAITIFVFNLTWGATASIQVLYATDILGLSDQWYGLFLAAAAVGGLIGSSSYGWLEARFSMGGMMRVGLVVETLTHLGYALTDSRWIALAIMFAFGLQASVWATTSRSVRQRAVDDEFQGRVASIYLFGVHTGIVIGGLIAGAIGSWFGIIAVYWYAFAGSALFLALIWMELPKIAHAAEAHADEITAGG